MAHGERHGSVAQEVTMTVPRSTTGVGGAPTACLPIDVERSPHGRTRNRLPCEGNASDASRRPRGLGPCRGPRDAHCGRVVHQPTPVGRRDF